MAKILWHDGIGLSLYAKRLDRGKFIWPSASGGAVSVRRPDEVTEIGTGGRTLGVFVVTGGAGFIGSAVVRRAIADGEPSVRALEAFAAALNAAIGTHA